MDATDQVWNVPPDNITLRGNEVHVWRASLNLPVSMIQELKPILSTEEMTRAERFYFERDRHRYIIAHALLRILLGRYLAIETSQIRFAYNAYGKPFLDLDLDLDLELDLELDQNLSSRETTTTLHFNLSHSHEMALYAFTYSRQVGIDIEYMRSNIDYSSLAVHYFSPRENAMLQELPEALRSEAFFNCWTRKEAYIKARGKGLSLPLELFDVSLKPGEPAALLGSREDPPQTAYWSLRELAPGAGYAGAFAVEGHDWDLCCWHYPF
jgi:4'-phosphopantetheinyl transferase